MTIIPTTKLPAIPAYHIMVAIEGAAFLIFATLSGVYRINEAGLNALQLILVGTRSKRPLSFSRYQLVL